MRNKIRSYINRICPIYAVIALIGSFLIETIVYEGSKLLIHGRMHYDLTTAFDRKIPVIPWFSIIYYGCYLFWVFNFILIARISKEHFYSVITAVYFSYLVCGVIFILFPTTNVRPLVTGHSFGDFVLRTIYRFDTPENLFPSIHCSVSWFCYIGLRGKKQIPKSYRVFSMLFAVAVFISTQVTKQHYLIDIAGGVILAEVSFYLAKKTNMSVFVTNFFEKVNDKIWTMD